MELFFVLILDTIIIYGVCSSSGQIDGDGRLSERAILFGGYVTSAHASNCFLDSLLEMYRASVYNIYIQKLQYLCHLEEIQSGRILLPVNHPTEEMFRHFWRQSVAAALVKFPREMEVTRRKAVSWHPLQMTVLHAFSSLVIIMIGVSRSVLFVVPSVPH